MIFFDLGTQKLVREVGGWGHVEALRLAVACNYQDGVGYQDWWEAQAGDLLATLHRAEMIVGFNVTKFDYRVLSLYGKIADLEDKTFDLFEEVGYQTGVKVSLNTLAMINLGEARLFESGVTAVRLYQTGKRDELIAFCRKDVELVRRLYELWETQGILWAKGTAYVVWPGRDGIGRKASERGAVVGSR